MEQTSHIPKTWRVLLIGIVVIPFLVSLLLMGLSLLGTRGTAPASAATNDTAFVYLLTDVSASGNGNINMTWRVVFAGPSIPGGQDFSEITVTVAPGDSPVTLRQKITDAVVTNASSFGYSIPKTNVTLLSFEKGQ